MRASDGAGTEVDLSLVMSGFDFEAAWPERRVFEVEGIARQRRTRGQPFCPSRVKREYSLCTFDVLR